MSSPSSPTGDSCSSCSLCPYLVLGTKISCRNMRERLLWLHGYSGLRLRVRGTPSAQDRLGIINHWRNSTAHIQGPSSHQLASRILELREALQHESRAPVPQNHFSQAPMAHLVGDCADYVPAPGTPVSSPGPRPSSPASFSPGSSARFQQKQACQFKTFNQEGARFSIYCSCRLKVTQVNPQVSGCEDLVFCLCVSFFPG